MICRNTQLSGCIGKGGRFYTVKLSDLFFHFSGTVSTAKIFQQVDFFLLCRKSVSFKPLFGLKQIFPLVIVLMIAVTVGMVVPVTVMQVITAAVFLIVMMVVVLFVAAVFSAAVVVFLMNAVIVMLMTGFQVAVVMVLIMLFIVMTAVAVHTFFVMVVMDVTAAAVLIMMVKHWCESRVLNNRFHDKPPVIKQTYELLFICLFKHV